VPAEVHMGFVVDKVTMGQVLSQVLKYFLSVLYCQCSLHIHSSVSDAVLSLQLTALLNNTCKCQLISQKLNALKFQKVR